MHNITILYVISNFRNFNFIQRYLEKKLDFVVPMINQDNSHFEPIMVENETPVGSSQALEK